MFLTKCFYNIFTCLLYCMPLQSLKHVFFLMQALTVIDDDEDGEVVLTSLSLWQEYCVHVKVEMPSSDVSNTSLPHCIYVSAGTVDHIDSI